MSTPEQLAYMKGYTAGRRKRRADFVIDRQQKELQAFADKVFVTCVAESMSTSGWKAGDIAISGIDARVKLAADFTRSALRQRVKV